ncbi:sensor domain-containing diguanylate cyclase [Egicoccus halophilus]|uniref:sensor domain-containing diguanylate cyclase n=1 Tax=Egicoccus halophilus TaxID=1670830 RepID=UPI00227CB238|nr:diguanylate cyclase [Egicoccus halophilus]
MAVEVAVRCLGADAASLSRFDRAEGITRVLRNHGDLAPWEEPRPLHETYRIDGWRNLVTVLLQGRSWTGTLDDPDLPGPDRDLLVSLDKYAALSSPVFVGGQVWGELYVTRRAGRPPFEELDLMVAQTLMGLVGAALRHLQDRAVLHELAYRDRLTGLGNRRAVDDRLERVFARDPLAAPVGLLVGDVNGLKEVNDEQGHAEGDRLLREVARVLTAEVARHPGGLAARIGGDEFSVVLEGVDDEQMQEVTKRLTAEVEALAVGDGLSCGFAVAEQRPGGAPSPAAAGRALLRLADAMQYRSKRQSRATRNGRVADGLGTLARHQIGAADRAAGRELAGRVLTAVQAADGDTEERLAALAASVAQGLGAASWWLSDSDGRDLVIRRGEYLRQGDLGTGTMPVAAGDRYPLADYPASAAVLRGGVFFATLEDGHSTERAFLAANGYVSMLAAGTTRNGVGWLVEIMGDAVTQPLAPHEGLLLALVELAANGAPGGR